MKRETQNKHQIKRQESDRETGNPHTSIDIAAEQAPRQRHQHRDRQRASDTDRAAATETEMSGRERERRCGHPGSRFSAPIDSRAAGPDPESRNIVVASVTRRPSSAPPPTNTTTERATQCGGRTPRGSGAHNHTVNTSQQSLYQSRSLLTLPDRTTHTEEPTAPRHTASQRHRPSRSDRNGNERERG